MSDFNANLFLIKDSAEVVCLAELPKLFNGSYFCNSCFCNKSYFLQQYSDIEQFHAKIKTKKQNSKRSNTNVCYTELGSNLSHESTFCHGESNSCRIVLVGEARLESPAVKGFLRRGSSERHPGGGVVFAAVGTAKERSALQGLETIAPLVRSVEENPEPIPTEVQGAIPSWIDGNLLRNGPGKFEFGNSQ